LSPSGSLKIYIDAEPFNIMRIRFFGPPLLFPFLFLIFFSLLLILLGYAYPIFPPGTDPPHHALLSRHILDQKTLAIYWPDGAPVNYPLFLHAITSLAAICGIPLYRAGFILSLALLLGSVVLVFLLLRRYSPDAAYFSLFLLCFSPVLLKYLLAGLYPNVLGMFLYLLLLILLVKTELESVKASLLCGFILGLLVLTHGIAAITGGIIVISFIVVCWLTRNAVRKEHILILAVTAVLVSLPWSFRIVPRLISGHHLLYAPRWITTSKGVVHQLFEEYGILLFLAAGGAATIKKMERTLKFLGLTAFIWGLLLLILSFSVWGHRFLMETVIPAGILSGLFLAELKKYKYFLPVLVVCLVVQTALFSSMYIPQLTFETDLERENLYTMLWVQDNTVVDAGFYHAVLLYPIYVRVIAQRDPVNVSVRSSAEKRFYPFQADLRTLAHPQVLKALQDNAAYVYLCNVEVFTFYEDQPFSPSVYLEENSHIFTGVYASGRARIYHIEGHSAENYHFILI